MLTIPLSFSPRATSLGSIQEDRRKVEQFHFLWNSSTKSGAVPLFLEQCPKNVEQCPKNAEQCPKNVEQLPKSGTVAEIGWNSSTICGTVPQFVEQVLVKVEQVQ